MSQSEMAAEAPVYPAHRKRRRRRRRRLTRWSPGAIATGVLARAGVGIVSAFDARWTLAAARAVGWLAWRFDARHRAIGRENLDYAYGDSLSAEAKDRILLGCFQNLTQSVVEVIHARRLVRQGRERECLEIESDARAREALERAGAVIFVSGHMGNWELLPLGIRLAASPLHSIVTPRRNPHLETYLVRVRESLGQKVVVKKGAFQEAMRFLGEGKAVGALTDQNQRKAGIFVDFFGRKACTTHGPALLARRSGAPILPTCIQRLPGTNRHRQIFGAPILRNREIDPKQDVRRMTQEYTSWLEARIRENADQWLWVHRRWRTRPPQERASRV